MLVINRSYILDGISVLKKINETGKLLKHLTEAQGTNGEGSSIFDKSHKMTIQIKDEITGINYEINDLKKTYQGQLQDGKYSKDDDRNCDGLLQILNLKIAALSQTFKDYLTVRSQVIEKQENAKKRFNFINDKDKISNRRVTSFKNSFQNGKRNRIFDDGDIEEEGLVHPNGLENGGERKQRFDQIEMIENRSENLENIKEALADINEIFTKFSEIVNTQQLMVERIDADTEMALLNAERGKKHLSEHYQNVSSYRNLIFKIFLILIIFATLYIIFVV